MNKTKNYTWFTRLICLLMAVHFLNISFDDNDVAFTRFTDKENKGNIIETMAEALFIKFFDIQFPDNNLDNGDSISAHHIDLIFEAYEFMLNPYVILLSRPYDIHKAKPLDGLAELNLPPPEVA